MTVGRKNGERGMAFEWVLTLLAAAALLPACGGGGGGGVVGIQFPPPPLRPSPGPGINSGLVIGKGSVVVNGVKFDNSAAPTFRFGFGDVTGTDNDVKVGMVVKMRGTFHSVESQGAYTAVEAEPQVIGTAVGGGSSFTVLNQAVAVTPFTVFEGIAGRTVNDGDAVEVHGTFTGPNAIQATHIRLGVAGQLQLRGVVDTIPAPGTLTIGAQQVTYTPPGPAGLAVGKFVEVEGVPAVDNLDATAGKLELQDFAAEGDQEIEIEGSVRAGTHDNVGRSFILLGPSGPVTVRYNTTFATVFQFEERVSPLVPAPTAAILDTAGAQVEVEGKLLSGVLQAREIELKRNENVVLEGNVSIVGGGPAFTVQPFPFTLTPPVGVTVSNGDHVEVGGSVVPGSTAITVTRVTPLLPSTRLILQGPVTAHGDGVADNTMTILGILVDTQGLQERDDPLVGPSEYENSANQRITKAQFFPLLQDLVTVVKAKAINDGLPPAPFDPGPPATYRPRAGVEMEEHR